MKKIIFILTLSLLLRFQASAAELKDYAGTLSGNACTFNLSWVAPKTVVGYFSRNDAPDEIFTIAGDNSRLGELFFSVSFKGRLVAYLKVRKSKEGDDVVWTGSMMTPETGAVMPVVFRRDSRLSL
jgi:hypothetical protein